MCKYLKFSIVDLAQLLLFKQLSIVLANYFVSNRNTEDMCIGTKEGCKL